MVKPSYTQEQHPAWPQTHFVLDWTGTGHSKICLISSFVWLLWVESSGYNWVKQVEIFDDDLLLYFYTIPRLHCQGQHSELYMAPGPNKTKLILMVKHWLVVSTGPYQVVTWWPCCDPRPGARLSQTCWHHTLATLVSAGYHSFNIA